MKSFLGFNASDIFMKKRTTFEAYICESFIAKLQPEEGIVIFDLKRPSRRFEEVLIKTLILKYLSIFKFPYPEKSKSVIVPRRFPRV